MSAITQPRVTGRPNTVTIASALLVLISALAVPTMFLIGGGFDPVVSGIGSIFIVLRVIAAVGLWQCRRWGAILGFVATLLDLLLALPGFIDGTVQDGMALMAVGVFVGIVTLVLIVLPSSRRAYV